MSYSSFHFGDPDPETRIDPTPTPSRHVELGVGFGIILKKVGSKSCNFFEKTVNFWVYFVQKTLFYFKPWLWPRNPNRLEVKVGVGSKSGSPMRTLIVTNGWKKQTQGPTNIDDICAKKPGWYFHFIDILI